VRSLPWHSTPQGRPSGLAKAVKEARERACHRQWWNSGVAQRRPVTSGQETAQGKAHGHRGSRANEMRVRRREKGGQRVAVHRAVFSDELGRDSGEQFPRRGSRGKRGLRERDGARSKTERLAVSWDGRN
jgi:hypothetical protein